MARPRRPSASSTTSSLPSSSHTTTGGTIGTSHELGSAYDYLAKIILLGPSGTGKSCLLHRFVKSEFRILSSQTIGVEFSSKIVKIGSPNTGTAPSRRRVKLQLWDTAGTERFRSVSRSYYRGAAGAILVYDVANMESFNGLQTFLMDARALAGRGLTVILAGNKADLAEPSSSSVQATKQAGSAAGEQIPPGSSASSRQSAFLPFDSGGTPPLSSRSRGESITMNTPTTSSTKWTATTASEGREVPPEHAARWASKNSVPATMEVSALTGENVDELFNRLARMILTKIELGEIDPDDPQSGIQYGDIGWDGMSVKSNGTADGEGGGGGTMRRRRKRGGGILKGVSEWGEVFRSPVGRGRRGCC